MGKDKLDSTDLKILKRLQENGKITNLQLSEDIGLSPAPTLERVRKLESAKIITGYHATVDESTLGIGIKAFIQLTLARQAVNFIKDFKERIDEIQEIVECYQVTGNCDFLLKIEVADIPAFEDLITNKLSTVEQIGNMQTLVILSQPKKSMVVPTTYE
ncbi:MAG: Lrp/AsnC family transcriptional regulator [Flavobacteriales bacterium]|nr:Lrp/AsnC family transcriptional regulator [Flavobacteriales bacterium]